MVGEKKPIAKTPLLETILSGKISGFAGVSRSLDVHKGTKKRRRKVVEKEAKPISFPLICTRMCKTRRDAYHLKRSTAC